MPFSPSGLLARWEGFEFSRHVLQAQADVVILSMAWQTGNNSRPLGPDMTALNYWIQRLKPIIQSSGPKETIVIISNRTGREGSFRFAGTSTVLGISEGEVRVYGMLDQNTSSLLVADTEVRSIRKIRLERQGVVIVNTSEHVDFYPAPDQEEETIPDTPMGLSPNETRPRFPVPGIEMTPRFLDSLPLQEDTDQAMQRNANPNNEE